MPSTLEDAWRRYREWAKTARDQKLSIDVNRSIVLMLGVIGAILAVESQSLSYRGNSYATWASWLSVAGGIAIAVAGVIVAVGLQPGQVQRWVRARAAAEAIKSQCFLFAASVSPYSGANRDTMLLDTTLKLAPMRGVTHRLATDAEVLDTLPPVPLPIPKEPSGKPSYETRRYEDQRQYYQTKFAQGESRSRIWFAIQVGLTFAAAILGVLNGHRGAYYGAWIAVLTSITGAVMSHIVASRYRELATGYQSSVDQLETLYDRWKLALAANQNEADQQFVLQCEALFMTENAGWVAGWEKVPADVAPQLPKLPATEVSKKAMPPDC